MSQDGLVHIAVDVHVYSVEFAATSESPLSCGQMAVTLSRDGQPSPPISKAAIPFLMIVPRPPLPALVLASERLGDSAAGVV